MSGTGRAAEAQRGRRILEERYNLEDALVVATFLNTFVNNAHIVKIANMAQLVNVIAPMFTNEKGLFLQTIYYPLELFANNTKGKALELFVDSPTYQEPNVWRVPYLDASAAYRQRDAGVQCGQPPSTRPIETDLNLQDKAVCRSGRGFGSEWAGYQSGERFRRHESENSAALAKADGKKLRYSFPAHSYTMLKAKLS